MALAAMDSEPVELPLDYLQGHKDGLEWAVRLAEANHPETGDWLYDDPIELEKAIRKGPDMPPAQPAADSEPVAVTDDELNAALQLHRLKVDGHSQLSDSFRAGFRYARRTTPQPALVVLDDVLAAIQKVARIRLDLNGFDGDRRGIADCLGNAEEALIEVVNRCAAMLAAAPQSPGSEPATVPGKWIPVCERVPTKQDGSVFLTWNGQYIGKELFLMGSFQCLKPEIITHWMPLPAAPQEVKGE
ncbi:DUF551 domain-containing protein [Klebsiella pneumoniae]|uniref:DUF551 domain-containing protein n=1 Tax=Klebsiella pneumoniae TaxID=573 RepID=UPI00103312FB